MMKIEIKCSYCGLLLVEEAWFGDRHVLPTFPSICGRHTCGNCEDTARNLLEEYHKSSLEEKVKTQERFYFQK